MDRNTTTPPRELIEVGYFLSKVGIDEPPPHLKARTWKEAFAKFYGSFGASKTETEFHNSLKNLRDHFDSHLSNNRAGWLEKDGKSPQELSSANSEVLNELEKLTLNELWIRIKPYATTSYDEKIAQSQSRKITREKAKYFSSEFNGRRELPGNQPSQAIVNHGLVVDSLKLHIERSCQDAFVYNTQKIDLAVEKNGILSKVYETKTSTDTQSICTAVGQLFMHTANSSDVQKWIVLPKPIKNNDLESCLFALGINLLLYEIDGSDVKFLSDSS